ncbi:MAG: hypothetical protein ACRD24_00340, partial [Terriglobales bacterium]
MKRHLACLILLCMVTSVPLSRAQAPATTIISDVIYRADGTPAGGTLLITWPAFATASGKAVAAGQKSISIGAGGAVSVSLVPNEGATPSGTYYRVVYKLDDGATSEELWSVPDVPTTTIAAIRSTVVPSGVAIQVASRQYVDTQISAVTGTRFHNVRYCDQFGGADAGAKIAACMADLPSSGGTADARAFEGAQIISSDVFTGVSKPVRLVLGAATYSVNASVTIPANITLEFSQGGSLSIATATTTTIKGTMQAPVARIFSLNGTGVVSFSGNNALREVYPQWWGAVGDGVADDTTAIQRAIAAVESATITDSTIVAVLHRVLFPKPSNFYKISAPLDVTKSYMELSGASIGVRIVNTTTDSHVLRVNQGATTSPLFGFSLSNLWLKGSGSASRALYMNGAVKPVVKQVSFMSHSGVCIYQESNVTGVTGTNFGNFEDIECQPSQAVTGIYDKRPVMNVYKNVRVREAEIGLDIVDGVGVHIIGSLFETNNRGTEETGIRATSTLVGAINGSFRTELTIDSTYFEGNEDYAVNADKGYFV